MKAVRAWCEARRSQESKCMRIIDARIVARRAVSSLNGFAGIYEAVVSIRLQEFEGRHYDIRGQMLAVAAQSDAFHSGATRTFDAGSGVFNDNAPGWRHSKTISCGQKYFRVGLAMVN